MSNIDDNLSKPKRFENDRQEKAFKVLKKDFVASETIAESLARRITSKTQLDALNALTPLKLDAATAVKHAERFDHDACIATKQDKNPNANLHVKMLKVFVKEQDECNKLQIKISKSSDKVSESDQTKLENCKKHPFSKADVDVALNSDESDYAATMCNKSKSANVLKALSEFKGRFSAEESFHCALRFSAEDSHERIAEMLLDSELRCPKPAVTDPSDTEKVLEESESSDAKPVGTVSDDSEAL